MTLVTAKPNIRRKPVYYNGIDRLFDEFFRFDQPFKAVNKAAVSTQPAVNILENEKDIQLQFQVPGWEKSDFQIKVEKNILSVEATQPTAEATEENQAEKVETPTYRRREFGKTNFKRSFQLPETVNAEAIDAKYVNGILLISLPKREEDKTKLVHTIEIG